MTRADKRRQKEVLRFWCGSAARDRATAKSLLKTKHHDWSLFLYHLALEKLLKALVVQAGITPPYTHKLVELARHAGLELNTKQRSWLREITDFNIQARYSKEKLAFYRKATAAYASTWHTRCDMLFTWLETHVAANKKR